MQHELRVGVVHCRYQRAGGEDAVVDAEVTLLRENGVSVSTLFFDNNKIQSVSSKIASAFSASFNPFVAKKVISWAAERRLSILHIHNVFPLISPAVFYYAHVAGIPTVLTLHNFRAFCANGILLRDGLPCELCVKAGASVLPAVKHRCFRSSFSGSAAVAASISLHKHLGTFSREVTKFVALSEFSKSKFVQFGIPEKKIALKPNFVFDIQRPSPLSRIGALYVGRLSAEKGLGELIEAWRRIDYPLTIIGDGPLRNQLERASPPSVTFLGEKPRIVVAEKMKEARFLCIPSKCYEMFPVVAAEAFCNSLPVVSAAIGSLREIVDDGITGVHFAPGDVESLSEACEKMIEMEPGAYNAMAQAGRQQYELRFSPKVNFHTLSEIYRDVLHPEHGHPRFSC